MRSLAEFCKYLARRLIDVPNLDVRYVFLEQPGVSAVWCTAKGLAPQLHWNVDGRRRKAVDEWASSKGEKFVGTLVHEFAHDTEGNHLDDRFHQAQSKIAGRLMMLVLADPDIPHLDVLRDYAKSLFAYE